MKSSTQPSLINVGSLQISEKILESNDFDVVNFANFYRSLAKKYGDYLGTDFFYTRKAVSYLPNFLPGVEHDHSRMLAHRCMRRILEKQKLDTRNAVFEGTRPYLCCA